MTAKACELHINNRWGYCYTPIKFASISDALRYAKGENGGFWYRLYAGGKLVRQGYCK